MLDKKLLSFIYSIYTVTHIGKGDYAAEYQDPDTKWQNKKLSFGSTKMRLFFGRTNDKKTDINIRDLRIIDATVNFRTGENV